MAEDRDPPTSVSDASGKTLLRYLHCECLTLILARHGQRGGPPVEGFPGKSLTPMGHRQAARLARRVAQVPLDHVYTSDMARAYQTAEAATKEEIGIMSLLCADLSVL